MKFENPKELGTDEPGATEANAEAGAVEEGSDAPQLILDDLLQNIDDADQFALLDLLNIC